MLNLTALSTDIGLRINDKMKREKLAWAEQVRLGDLFVEAFFHYGYVDIGYTRKSDSWYTVEVTPKWTELADIPGLLERVRLNCYSICPILWS